MPKYEVRPCTLLFHGPEREPVWKDAFARHAPQVRFCPWPDWDPGDQAEYALVWQPPPGELARHRSLRAIFSVGAGIDHLSSDPEMPAAVPVIRMVDPTLTAGMSEYVVYHVLLHHREMLSYIGQQRACLWRAREAIPASHRTVGVMGVGVLGKDVLAKLKPFGFKLRGWSRSSWHLNGIERFAGRSELPAFLDKLDILVCLLPLTAETRGILNHEVFARLPDGAAIINVGRGEHLVEEDLISALERGRIRAASLDVFLKEPVPQDHPFWQHPRVVVTPHIASMTSPHTAVPGVLEQIQNNQNGGAFSNVVDLTRGY